MRYRPVVVASLFAAAVPILALSPASAGPGPRALTRAPRQAAPPSLDVRVVADEPEAVLAILRKKRAGETVGDEAWQQLFASEGYVRLKKRETSLGRPFADEDFKAFVLSEKTVAGLTAYEAQIAAWKTLDAQAAADIALRYLPAGTVLRASVYPSIKPRENSFVFELTTNPAIFFYMNPAESEPVSRNTLAHELHHVGMAAGCDAAMRKRIERYPAKAAGVIEMIGSFSEGLAMVAAAGGPLTHPHAESSPEIRAGWDKDVANFEPDLRKVEAFFLDVQDGRLSDAAEIRKRHMEFFGFQGPWYTVGWKMAVTIEQALGHDAVVSSFCSWDTLLSTYNRAARDAAARGAATLPTWSPRLVEAVRRPD